MSLSTSDVSHRATSKTVLWINNFVQERRNVDEETNGIKIDLISKCYIITELLLGTFRLNYLDMKKKCYVIPLYCYNLLLFMVILYNIIIKYESTIFSNLILLDWFQYLICTVISISTSKKLRKFYKTLNKFDQEVGFVAKTSKESLYTIIQLIMTVIKSFTLYFASQNLIEVHNFFNVLIIALVELHYQGHLFSLLIQRIKAMENCCKLAFLSNPNLPNKRQIKIINYEVRCNSIENCITPITKPKNKSHIKIQKLPHHYNKLLIVYNCLYEAVKWQVCCI